MLKQVADKKFLPQDDIQVLWLSQRIAYSIDLSKKQIQVYNLDDHPLSIQLVSENDERLFDIDQTFEYRTSLPIKSLVGKYYLNVCGQKECYTKKIELVPST